MLHRPRTAVTKSAVILGLYVVAALGAAAMPFARLPGEWPTIAVAALLVAAFVVGQQLVRYNFWLQLGGLLAGAAFVFCTGYHYVLKDDQERPIRGHLSDSVPEFDIGERVTVVVERHNWVDPQTPSEVGDARSLRIAALIGLALTMVLSVLGPASSTADGRRRVWSGLSS
ncbi:hypothetical protein [Dactylosporangium sp. CA-233914]|uniref:hypothetical protein n=1 Tax=Dactylosporangium sp. CA-233914 TaxID=3239934 RepID=UPI003D8E34DA